MKRKLNSWFILFVLMVLVIDLNGQNDSLLAKPKKRSFGFELGIGKPPLRYYSKDWIRNNPGHSTYVQPISFCHVYFTYSVKRKDDASYNFYFGGFQTRYNYYTSYNWQVGDSLFVYSRSKRNEIETSFSVGFSAKKLLKLNKSGKLFFAPEAGLFFNALAFEQINDRFTSATYRIKSGFIEWWEPTSSYNSEEYRKGSLFNAPSNVNDVYSISPLLRMALIRKYKKCNLNLNYNMVFMPYYSISYYKHKTALQFSNISLGVNF